MPDVARHTYTVRLTSDDWTSECEFSLTAYQWQVLLDVAKAFNEKATFAVDIRWAIGPSSAAPQGEVA